MQNTAVRNVTVLPDPSGRIRACEILSPRPDTRLNPWALTLRGWVVGARAPVHTVEVRHGSAVVASLPLTHRSLERARRFLNEAPALQQPLLRVRVLALRALARMGVPGDGHLRGPLRADLLYSGFDASLPLLGLPARCTLRLVALTTAGDAVPFADLAIDRPTIQLPPDAGRFQPLMVTSIGRSGSTWFQHLISQHPAISSFPVHPYEVAMARELAYLFAGAASSGPFAERFLDRKHFRTLFAAPAPGVPAAGGPQRRERFEALLAAEAAELVEHAARSIDRFYAFASEVEGGKDAREGLRYFSEKNLRPEWFFWEVYEKPKEIFLVRDFRDVICSSLAANAKWGKRFFGRRRAESDRDYVFLRAQMARSWILEPWLQRGAGAHLVRYEDVILRPAETLRGILEYLELDASDDAIRGMLGRASASQGGDARSEHMTSSSADASIGRWKTDLPAPLVDACDEAFGEFFAAFYPPGGAAPLAPPRVPAPASHEEKRSA